MELGADKVMKQYEVIDGVRSVVSISFIVTSTGNHGDRTIPFQLPADRALTLGAMRRWRGVPRTRLNSQHANNVAWRNLVEWVRSQVVHIYVGGASLDEVFMPYMLVGDRTLYQCTHTLEHGIASLIPKLGYNGG